MAIGTKSNFVIYDEEFSAAFVETLGQAIEEFRAGFGGAVNILTAESQGDYRRERFFDFPSGGYVRRDITDVSTDLTPTAMTQDENIGVKLSRRYGPYSQTEDAFRRIAEDPRLFSTLLGENYAKVRVQEMLNTSIGACAAAITTEGNNLYDYAATGANATLDHTALVRGKRKMGDAADRVKVWVTNSGAMEALEVEQLSAGSGNVADFQIYQGGTGTLGLPMFVSDISYLTTSGTPGEYHVLGLVDNAIEIVVDTLPIVAMDRKLLKANLEMILQGEDDYVLGLKGFKWDTTNGGVNPTTANVVTGSNWDVNVASNKDLAGVKIDVDQS